MPAPVPSRRALLNTDVVAIRPRDTDDTDVADRQELMTFARTHLTGPEMPSAIEVVDQLPPELGRQAFNATDCAKSGRDNGLSVAAMARTLGRGMHAGPSGP